ncbi:MAG TPA: serine/threonine-protein kinase [Pirellulaceae bacterium]|jgi:serine/threonine protein kinase|nr:serine/threonine-protein kinase [Pirellulaceae bacterium]
MTDPAFDDRRAAPDIGSVPGGALPSRPAQVGISDSDYVVPLSRARRPDDSPDAVPAPTPLPTSRGCYFGYPSGSAPLDGYTIKRGIGVGGFGEVYFAVSEAGKEVALKRILRNVDIELRGVKQCLNLKHVHLVSLFDIRQDQHGQTWVVMEHVAGECLKDKLDRNPHGLPQDEVDFWTLGIGLGTAYLHDRGIVHRDLKPGNIFLDEGVVKIGDYGLSKFIARSQRVDQTQSVGTFHYMAPEIGKGEYGREVDIYALGVMLFEMTTGTLPFLGETSQEIALKHLTATADLSPVPERYRAAVERCLRKNPAERFSRVEELLDSLDLPSGPGVAAFSWIRRRDTEEADSRPTDRGEEPLIAEPVRDEPFVRGPSRVAQVLQEVEDGIALGDVHEAPEKPGAALVPAIRKDRSAGNPFRDGWSSIGEIPQPSSQAGRSLSTTGAGSASPAALVIERHDPQEPIAAAVRKQWRKLADWWISSRMSAPAKVLLLIAAVTVVLLNSQWLVPLLVCVGIVYFPYYAGRAVWLAVSGNYDRLDVRESDASEPPIDEGFSVIEAKASAGATISARRSSRPGDGKGGEKKPEGKLPLEKRSGDKAAQKKEAARSLGSWALVALGFSALPQSRYVRQHLDRLPASARATELFASLLMASAVVAALSLLGLAVGGRATIRDVDTAAFYLWLTITAGFASWTLVALGKLWETRPEEPMVRRIASALVGTATGAVSFATATYLDVPLTDELGLTLMPALLGEPKPGVGASAFGISSFLAFFCGAFLVPHWWRQVDPQRKTRLALMSVIGCVLWTALLHVLVPFAQPWGLLAVGIVAIAVQLSAPWISPASRTRIRAKAKTAVLRRHPAV